MDRGIHDSRFAIDDSPRACLAEGGPHPPAPSPTAVGEGESAATALGEVLIHDSRFAIRKGGQRFVAGGPHPPAPSPTAEGEGESAAWWASAATALVNRECPRG